MYVGLIEKKETQYQLTKIGKDVVLTINRKSRNIKVIKAIASTVLFYDLLNLYYNQNNKISDQQIIDRLFKENIAGSTPARRMSTIKAWLNWTVDQVS